MDLVTSFKVASASDHVCILSQSTLSYRVLEAPGSLLKNSGNALEWSLFRDTQLDTGDFTL